MKRLVIALAILALLLPGFQEISYSQETDGRWMIGFHGGTNFWVSDFNKLKFSPAGDLMVRYGVNKYLSFGLTGGYGEAKSDQEPLLIDLDYGYRLGTVQLKAIPVSILGFVHMFPASSFNPYMYVGAGAFHFKRMSGSGTYLPDSKYRTSLMIPLGVGFDAFTSKNISIGVDVGFRSFGDWIDFRRNSSPDGFLSARAGLNIYFDKGEADDDEDGLLDADERRYGTDPEQGDTDGDGLKDGEEVNRYRTNPLRSDTDGDNLSDGDEVLKYKTSPTKTDSDLDLVSDGDEVLTYKSDPTQMDTDGDGLNDGEELLGDKTDPLKVDTDGDGLSDGDEVRQLKTDPRLADTDKDGLSDNEEARRTRTDPRKADTDGGGELDGAEVKRGANPLSAGDDSGTGALRLERGASVTLQGVNFKSGSATLARSSEASLRRVLLALQENSDLQVEIAGYTDSEGRPAANERLSQMRAEAVKAWLVKQGIVSVRLTTVGYGSRSPVATNLTAEGRAKNRRIEFHVK